MAKKHIVIERSIKITYRYPVDEESYPGMTHVQAVDHELQLPRQEKIEVFVDKLEATPPGEVELTERVWTES